MPPRDAYARAGVDLKKVRSIHGSIAETFASTFASRKGKFGMPLMGIGHYAGVIDIGGGNALALHTDGVGTKVLVAQQLKKFDTVGVDCVAMTVNDLICLGCEPVALLDYIALEREDDSLVRELSRGLVKGAGEAGVAIVGGETAIMGDLVKGVGGCGFDLISMGVGVVRKRRLIDGSSIESGDVVLGVESSGLHSNGYTLARKVLLRNHRLDAHLNVLGETLGEALLRPTLIYVKPALESIARFEVHGIGHITGGAFGKLTRLTGNRNLGFRLEKVYPPPLFRLIQREGKLSDGEMLRTFNMGIGLCLVCPRSEAEGVVRIFAKQRMKARQVGVIEKGKGVLVNGLRVA